MNATINVNWVPGITLEEMEKQCILSALRFYRGNKTQTAQVLGIAIRTLDNKLERYAADAKRDQDRVESDRQERERQLKHQRGLVTELNGLGVANQTRSTPTQAPEREPKSSNAEADAGVHVQPSFEPPAKHAVPMSKHEEIQSVLPKHATGNSKHRGR